MRLNLFGSGHEPKDAAKKPISDMTEFPQFIAPTYARVDDVTKDPDERKTLNVGNSLFETLAAARRYLDLKVQDHKPCNDCFRRLPGRRSFKDIYNDPDVWVNYTEVRATVLGNSPPAGLHEPGTKEIAVHSYILNRGYLWVAATIVHELAHVNGASGRSDDNSAERTLKFCLLAQMFNPDVFGLLDTWRDPNGGTALA